MKNLYFIIQFEDEQIYNMLNQTTLVEIQGFWKIF